MRGRRTMTRRELLTGSALGVAGAAATAKVVGAGEKLAQLEPPHDPDSAGTVGAVTDVSLDPVAFLEEFDFGQVSTLPGGQTLRRFEIRAVNREIEIAPGVFFPAWTYNGQVPGPTLRATEGDLVRVRFHNRSPHPHTIHFHGIHPANMDGVFEVVQPGETFVYEFVARPFGLHLYH